MKLNGKNKNHKLRNYLLSLYTDTNTFLQGTTMQDYIQRGRMQVASVLDNFINEQAIGALTDFLLARGRVGLSRFIESHDHDCSAMATARTIDISPSLAEPV